MLRTISSEVSGSGGNSGSAGSGGNSGSAGSGGNSGSAGSGGNSDSAGSDAATRARAAAVAGGRPLVAAMPSVERRITRVVPTTPARVARTTPATPAPVTRITPATNRKTARMSAPSVEIRREVTHSSACPTIPPRSSNRGARQKSVPCNAPGPTPSVPAASANVIAPTRHSTPVRSGRTGGRTSRASTNPPATMSAAGTT